MKKFISVLLTLLLTGAVFGQSDSTETKRWRINSFGVSAMDGNFQFFEGYNYQILYSNSRYGLPLYPDWSVYSGIVLMPEFYRYGGHINIVDSSRGLKIRVTGDYTYRKDSMATTSGFALNDTIFGRNASEEGVWGGITVTGMKQTRKLGGFLRLYGGAEFEASISPRSNIFFLEYSFDVGESRVVEQNVFNTQGKARLNLWGRALLGIEMVFFERFGINAEVKSGLGTQIVLQETSFGLAANAWYLGLNYYLFDFTRAKRISAAPAERPFTPLPSF